MRSARSCCPLVVTTSWDDGHPSDLRLADLLTKHGILGTFYVPSANCEGRPVVSPKELVSLAASFEIGGHTRDHVDLTRLPLGSALNQVASNKATLEDRLGREVTGFAYVRGQFNPAVRDLVRQAGYRYARSTRNLASRPGTEAFDVPTTIQFFQHSSMTYVKNFLRSRLTFERLYVLSALQRQDAIERRCFRAAIACASIGTHFHLWGHSWELDQHDLWAELDRFFQDLRTLNARFVSNAEWFAIARRDDCQDSHPGRYTGTERIPVGP